MFIYDVTISTKGDAFLKLHIYSSNCDQKQKVKLYGIVIYNIIKLLRRHSGVSGSALACGMMQVMLDTWVRIPYVPV